MATAPPFTLTFWEIEAELAHHPERLHRERLVEFERSTSPFFHPVLSISCGPPSTGAIITHLGSTPLVACATMRTIGGSPSSSARVALVYDTRRRLVHAGSVTRGHGAILLESGLERAQHFDAWCLRGAIRLCRRSPAAPPFFFAGSSTGTICDLKRHSFDRGQRLTMRIHARTHLVLRG